MLYTPPNGIGLAVPSEAMRRIAAGALALCCVSAPAAAQLVQWQAGAAQGFTGDAVSIDISVSNFTSIVSAQGSFHWDTSVVSFVDANNFALSNMDASNLDVSGTNEGRLGFSWYDASLNGESLSDGTSFITLNFDVVGAPGTQSDIALEQTPQTWEVTNSTLVNLPYDLTNGLIESLDTTTSVVEQGNRVGVKAWPMPVVDQLNLTFPIEAHWASVVDMNGRTVYETRVAHGQQALSIPTGHWVKGCYTVLLTGTHQQETLNVIKHTN